MTAKQGFRFGWSAAAQVQTNFPVAVSLVLFQQMSPVLLQKQAGHMIPGLSGGLPHCSLWSGVSALCQRGIHNQCLQKPNTLLRGFPVLLIFLWQKILSFHCNFRSHPASYFQLRYFHSRIFPIAYLQAFL